MNNTKDFFKGKVVKSFDITEQYVKLSDAVETVDEILLYQEKLSQQKADNQAIKETDDYKIINLLEVGKYFFTRKILLVALFIFAITNLDVLFMFYSFLTNEEYRFEWHDKIYIILKVLTVIPIAIATSETLNWIFKDYDGKNEANVPSPKAVVYYLSQSWLLYILLASGLTIYNFNLERIGIENLSDFVATFNATVTLIALVQFIMWRWFRNYYNFIFSTIDDINDSNSTFSEISSLHKTYISILIIIGLLWVAKDIFIAFLSQ